MSKLSVMTGVHRKDVARFEKDGRAPKRRLDLVAKVLGQWQTDSRFLTKGGKPRTLDDKGKASEFTELVRSVSNDLNPYTVLNELERSGAIERTARGVKLVSRIYNVRADVRKGLKLLAEDSQDLFSAVEHNLFEEYDTPNLHIRTEYDNIPAEHVDAIRTWLVDEGSAFHKRVRQFLSQFDRDVNREVEGAGKRTRISLGSFSCVEAVLEENR